MADPGSGASCGGLGSSARETWWQVFPSLIVPCHVDIYATNADVHMDMNTLDVMFFYY